MLPPELRPSIPTALDIGTTAYDQPRLAPGVVRRRYVLCGTQRQGSTLLSRLLINAGLGVPHEYFNPRHVQPLRRAWGRDPSQGLPWLEALHEHRTTANGAWGLKLQWPQFVEAVQPRPGLADALFDGAAVFHLQRRDLHAQSVSLHLSIVTGIWGVRGVRTTHERHDIGLGNEAHLRWCARTIRDEEARWQAFYATRGLQAQTLVYEDLVREPVVAVRRVADALGLAIDQWRQPPHEPKEPRDAALADLIAGLITRRDLTDSA